MSCRVTGIVEEEGNEVGQGVVLAKDMVKEGVS